MDGFINPQLKFHKLQTDLTKCSGDYLRPKAPLIFITKSFAFFHRLWFIVIASWRYLRACEEDRINFTGTRFRLCFNASRNVLDLSSKLSLIQTTFIHILLEETIAIFLTCLPINMLHMLVDISLLFGIPWLFAFPQASGMPNGTDYRTLIFDLFVGDDFHVVLDEEWRNVLKFDKKMFSEVSAKNDLQSDLLKCCHF